MRASKKFANYSVTLRRDVQIVASVVVEARSRQEAIDVTESIASDPWLWKMEKHIGAHKPEVHRKVQSK